MTTTEVHIPELAAVVVNVVGHVPCGCGHCQSHDLQAGWLVQETYVGTGSGETQETAALAAVNDALEQAYEVHPHGELMAETCIVVPNA